MEKIIRKIYRWNQNRNGSSSKIAYDLKLRSKVNIDCENKVKENYWWP